MLREEEERRGEGEAGVGVGGRACKCLTRAPITGYWICVVYGCGCGG